VFYGDIKVKVQESNREDRGATNQNNDSNVISNSLNFTRTTKSDYQNKVTLVTHGCSKEEQEHPKNCLVPTLSYIPRVWVNVKL
jgi:hypothetical protein